MLPSAPPMPPEERGAAPSAASAVNAAAFAQQDRASSSSSSLPLPSPSASSVTTTGAGRVMSTRQHNLRSYKWVLHKPNMLRKVLPILSMKRHRTSLVRHIKSTPGSWIFCHGSNLCTPARLCANLVVDGTCRITTAVVSAFLVREVGLSSPQWRRPTRR